MMTLEVLDKTPPFHIVFHSKQMKLSSEMPSDGRIVYQDSSQDYNYR